MFTPDSSKSTMNRIAAALKVGAVLVLMGLLVVATERPMLLSPRSAVNAAQVRALAKTRSMAQKAPQADGADAAAVFGYSPSGVPGPAGPVEDLPPRL